MQEPDRDVITYFRVKAREYYNRPTKINFVTEYKGETLFALSMIVCFEPSGKFQRYIYRSAYNLRWSWQFFAELLIDSFSECDTESEFNQTCEKLNHRFRE